MKEYQSRWWNTSQGNIDPLATPGKDGWKCESRTGLL
jgi:hypothetical protein